MTSESPYPRLFEPLELRGKTLRNRMVMPAMATHFADPDGGISPAIADYLGARAEGGFGMVITENLGIHASGKSTGRMAMVDSDAALPGLAKIAAAIRKHGALAIAQINHSGRQTSSRITGQELVAPSALPCPLMREMPRELDLDGIAAMQNAYVMAARRTEEAGFDGVEVHAAHGYLAASFLSAYSNHRKDGYGGGIEGRMRFLLEIVGRIRAAAAPSFLLSVRISAHEFVTNGLTPDDAIIIGKGLEAEGTDLLSLSVGVFESYQQLTMLSGEPENPWLPMLGGIRRSLSIPIIGVGRIKRPEAAETALATGQIDLAAFGRTALTNPRFPIEIAETPEKAESACIGCNLCLGRTADPKMVCPINPFVGREALLESLKPAPWQTIVIDGGGFAALTAGWLAARRGAEVTLFEPDGLFGGLQELRGRVPGQTEYSVGTRALIERARRAGVRFSRHAQGDDIPRWIVRTREKAVLPDLPIRTISAYDTLRHPENVAEAGSILVVGDDLSAADAALLLADRGHAVTLRSPTKDICFDSHPGFRRLNREAIELRGGTVTAKVPEEALFAGDFDLVVIGRRPDVVPADSTESDSSIALEDEYEPGALTRAVYAAVDLALAEEA